MKIYWKEIGVLCSLGLAMPSQAAIDEGSIIKGFAEWQSSRIEKIVLDLSLSRISDNTHIVNFFPSTASSLDYELDSNGQSLARVVQYAINQDLDRMKYISGQCLPNLLNKSLGRLSDQVNIDGTLVEGVDTNVFKQVKDDLKKIYLGFQNMIEGTHTSIQFDKIICTETNYSKGWSSEKIDPLAIKRYLNAMVLWVENGAALEDEKFKKFLQNNRLGLMIEYLISLSGIIDKFNSSANQKVLMKKEDIDEIGYVQQVTELMKMLDVYLGFGDQNYPAFRKLKQTSLFLAALADASNTGSTDVAAVLKLYVDDQDAFRAKREPTGYFNWFSRYTPNASAEGGEWKNYHGSCRNWLIFTCEDSIFISSFWGFAFSHDTLETSDTSSSSNGWRPFGPLGIEWKLFTFDNRPLSLNYAPIDIGNYVNNELMDTEYSPKLSDIDSPSVFLSYSMKRYPVAYLIGHQWDIVSVRGEEDSWFLAITFDLPVFTLY